MFDWLLPEKHAIAILKKDHDTVKDLFDRFEKAGTPAAKQKIIGQALEELKLHAVVEEEIFYPAVRPNVGDKIMNEADEEHHVAKVLIAELDTGSATDAHRDAKFTVLAENVRHHIKEEEDEVLPKAKEMDIDFEKLGQRILDRKAEMKAKGIPADAEHAMVAKAGRGEDSPARAAAKPNKAAKAPVKATAAKRRRPNATRTKTARATH